MHLYWYWFNSPPLGFGEEPHRSVFQTAIITYYRFKTGWQAEVLYFNNEAKKVITTFARLGLSSHLFYYNTCFKVWVNTLIASKYYNYFAAECFIPPPIEACYSYVFGKYGLKIARQRFYI